MSLIAHYPLNGHCRNTFPEGQDATSNSTTYYQTTKVGSMGHAMGQPWSHQMYFRNPFIGLNEWSLSFWFKNNGSNDWGDVFTFSGGLARMEVHGSNGSYTWYCNTPSYGDIFTSGTTITGSATTGRWYNVIITFKNGTSVFYIDGAEKIRQTGKTTFTANSEYLYFNSRVNSAYMNSEIVDIRCYDHALSALEIKDTTRALVLHYNFEELYRPLEYIESTGTQFFNTSVTIEAGTRVETKIIFKGFGSYPMVYGAWDVFSFSPRDDGTLCVSGGGTAIQPYPNASTTFALNTPYEIDHRPNYIKMNTTQYSLGGSSNRTGTGRQILLFAASDASTGNNPYNWSTYAKVRMFYFKIYNGNTLVRDFIPVLRQYDGKVGMFDRVNGVFYTNQGRGDFTYKDCFKAVHTKNARVIAGEPTNGNTVYFSKSADGWGDCGITSVEAFDKGYVATTVNQTNKYIMIGVAPTNTSFNYTQGYFMYASADGNLVWYDAQSGSSGTYGAYAAGDRFRVAFNGTTIYYYKNDACIRTLNVRSEHLNVPMYMNITSYLAAEGSVRDTTFGRLDLVKDVSGKRTDGWCELFAAKNDAKTGETSYDTGTNNSFIKLPSLYLDTAFTITGWVKHLNHTTWARIFDFGTAAAGGDYAIGLATSDTNGSICLFGRTGSGAALPDTTVDTWATNTWYHFAVVVNGTSIKYYVNGSLKASFTSNAAVGGRTYTLNYIAKSNWSGDGYSRKYFSDFKIFNSALSAEDIAACYNNKLMLDTGGSIHCEKLSLGNNSLEFPTTSGVIKSTDFIGGTNIALYSDTYERLEYIQSTGAQEINTGYYFDTNEDCFEIKFQATTSNQNGMIFACTGNNYLWFYHYVNSGYIDMYIARGGSHARMLDTNDPKYTYDMPAVDTNIHIARYEKGRFYSIDGKVVGGDSRTGSNVGGSPMYLFSWGSMGYPYQGRIYSCKIWRKGSLVRDFIPVRKKSNGLVGLLDRITGVFYSSTTSTNFQAGGVAKPMKLIGAKNIYEGIGCNTVNKISS